MGVAMDSKMQSNGKTQDWWLGSRRVTVVVDNPSWILPYAELLVAELNESKDQATLVRRCDDIPEGDVAFFLGCVSLTPPEILGRNRTNLVVHESNLPEGRGFSPLTWQILAGENEIPVALLHMTHDMDAGPVAFKEFLHFKGNELLDELRSAQGQATIALCRRFLDASTYPLGVPQVGLPTYFKRRRPEDSRLDPHRSISEQFNLMRVVDNEKYPAFFDLAGQRYFLYIEKAPSDQMSQK